MRSLNLTLPFPPSMNHYWIVLRHGRLAGQPIISGAGKRYRADIMQSVKIPPGWDNAARFGVSITLYPPTRAKRDLDNYLKPLLDSLQHARVFLNDEQVDDLRICRAHVVDDGMLDVFVQKLEAEAIADAGGQERIKFGASGG
jgi:crossover junction endodeoxyribonuclease RusA